MTDSASRTIAVVGATGMQGRAVTRRLLQDGWSVRALTRDPTSRRARELAALGAIVVAVDAAEADSLEVPFRDAHGVFTVHNHHISGYAGEVAQGKNVADMAVRTGVEHVVYSAAIGRDATGVGSWDTKVQIIGHMRERGVPLTVLRPMAFMELMTESKFVPAASTWSMMPRLMGADRPVGWLAVDDLAAIAARAFSDPDRFVGMDQPLVSDVRSLRECADLWRQTMGRAPRRLPLPVWLFERFVGTDETTMWRWLRDHEIDLDTAPTLALHPNAVSVETWLLRQRPPQRWRARARNRPVPG